MKILLICPYFPPENTIAAVRIGKFSQYWAEAGHEVTVLCRRPLSTGLAVPDNPAIRTIAVPDPLGGVAVRTSAGAESRSGRLGEWFKRLKTLARAMMWPDFCAPWAVRAARVFRQENRRDFNVVVASVGPFSSLLLGSAISRRLRTPLVVDYRDMLAYGPYYDHGRVRTWVDKRIERRVSRRAALMVGVSNPMSSELKMLFDRSVSTVTNGFEPDDFRGLEYKPNDPILRIAYCGQIYKGRRDPRPLFEAIHLARVARPDLKISVDFYGRGLSEVVTMGNDAGIADVVRYHGEVTHAESLQIQAQADLLLLMLWNNPGEKAVLSGKIFEYMGARRPILMLGFADGAAAKMIRDNQLGIVGNEPRVLAQHLISYADQKKREGSVSASSEASLTQFTRRSQSMAFLLAMQRALRVTS